jgi:hypothetical protein
MARRGKGGGVAWRVRLGQRKGDYTKLVGSDPFYLCVPGTLPYALVTAFANTSIYMLRMTMAKLLLQMMKLWVA